jgi:hypothetical protein
VKVRLTNTREIAMISYNVRFRYECNRNACSGKSGTQLEREWNANGTQMERIYERVPNAFSVRLFLSSTVMTYLGIITNR